jgi:ribulose-phosphate 3-epimerase
MRSRPRHGKIAPSILSADLGNLAAEIRQVEAAGADWIHVDVMDGHFVPNITLGPVVLQAARAATSLPLDVHLMITNPDEYLEAFAEAGADILTVHVETCADLKRTLGTIARLGKRAGVTMNPDTDDAFLRDVIELVDVVLVMSVHPGFAGQTFRPAQLDKVARIRALIDATGRSIDLEIDGGIQPSNARRVVDAGVDVLVAGSAVFGQADRAVAIRSLRAAFD